MIEHLKVTDYKKMLWKNGAGYTLELARSAGDNLDSFDWRISMADVTTSGSFSKFHQMQRILTVLEGQGITLNIENEIQHLGLLQSVQFSGDHQVSCELIDGKIRDFNLIYDPKKFHARYQWIFSQEKVKLFSSAELMLIFNQNLAPLEIEINQQCFHLEHQESLKVERIETLQNLVLSSKNTKQCCLIELIKS